MGTLIARLIGSIGAAALLIAFVLPWALPARGADPSYGFVLNNGGTDGSPGGTPYTGLDGNYPQLFAGVEISATPDSVNRRYVLEANDSDIPLSWDFWPHDAITGMGSFSMRGFYDPVANTAAGTFTVDQQASGVVHHGVDVWPVRFALHWQGAVTGSAVDSAAEFFFSGSQVITCIIAGGGADGADDDCSKGFVKSMPVWFDFSNSYYTVVPGLSDVVSEIDEENRTGGATVDRIKGDVELSSDGETTWRAVGRDPLKIQDMIRTGPNSYVTLVFQDGSIFRVKPNSKVTLLAEGLQIEHGGSWLNLKKHGKTFQLITPTTVAGVLGTTVATTVSPDGTTRYEVAEGVIMVTATQTSQQVELTQGNAATVTQDGQIAVAPFDVAALQAEWQALEDAAEPTSPGSPGVAAPGPDPLVFGILVAIALVFVALIAVALITLALQMKRRAS